MTRRQDPTAALTSALVCLLRGDPEGAADGLAQVSGWVLSCAREAHGQARPAEAQLADKLRAETARADKAEELAERLAHEVAAAKGREVPDPMDLRDALGTARLEAERRRAVPGDYVRITTTRPGLPPSGVYQVTAVSRLSTLLGEDAVALTVVGGGRSHVVYHPYRLTDQLLEIVDHRCGGCGRAYTDGELSSLKEIGRHSVIADPDDPTPEGASHVLVLRNCGCDRPGTFAEKIDK